jgi:hypothetical protein
MDNDPGVAWDRATISFAVSLGLVMLGAAVAARWFVARRGLINSVFGAAAAPGPLWATTALPSSPPA